MAHAKLHLTGLSHAELRSALVACSQASRDTDFPNQPIDFEGMALVGLEGPERYRLRTPKLAPLQAALVLRAVDGAA